MHCTARLFILVFSVQRRLFYAPVFAVAVAVFLPGLRISKFLLFSDTDDGPLRPKSILAF